MSRNLEHLERRVERGMSLLTGDGASPRAGALDRVRRAMLEEAHRLTGEPARVLWRPARGWTAAAAILLALGLTGQFASVEPAPPAVDPEAALSDWAVAMDRATHVVVSLHEDPWLPDDLHEPREEDAERTLNEAWESFESAFDLGV